MSMLNPIVAEVIQAYPDTAKSAFHEIRSLIFEIAKDNELGKIEETLKWGQPSYLSKYGSTVRVDWNSKNPDNIDILFNCKTILVETFKEIFNDELTYKGNRVVVIELSNPVPVELKTCILMALNYHQLKKLPLLGA